MVNRSRLPRYPPRRASLGSYANRSCPTAWIRLDKTAEGGQGPQTIGRKKHKRVRERAGVCVAAIAALEIGFAGESN